MLKKVSRFFRDYKQFGLVLITVIVCLGLFLAGFHTAANWILAAVSILIAIPLAWGMVQDLRVGKWGIDILALTAILTSVYLKEYWTAIIIVFMLTGGEALEDYAERRAKVELSALLSRVPKKAHVIRGRKELDIPVKDIKVGDKLLIKPGEVVPVDAVIVEGETSLDESSLTGESLPVNKKINEDIMSGAINMESAITVRALQTAENSQYEQIIQLVRDAASTEAPFVRLTDRYAVPFTIVSFAIAGTVWALSGDPMRFLQVIVVATPCPLLLAAPIALVSGMSRAAKHGIIIKSGSALEKLAQVKTVGFDKTGTLTRGVPTVDDVTTFKPFNKSDVLQASAALEQSSNHVLAKAIVHAAEKLKLNVPKPKNLQEIAGHGIEAGVAGKHVLVGKFSFLKENQVSIPAGFKSSSVKSTATYVAIDGKLAGVITFTDEIRPEASKMLARLKKLGISHTLMVTGDNQSVASAIAKKLGISEVLAEALPGDKVRAIEAEAARPVAFVGDGVNDAPVLTAADVGIALGARGSTAASESADVVILLDDISQVAKALEIAKHTFSIARQTILVGIGLSIILQLIFATGKFPPIYGAILQEVVDVVVIFNALRAHGSFTTKRVALPKKPTLQQA